MVFSVFWVILGGAFVMIIMIISYINWFLNYTYIEHKKLKFDVLWTIQKYKLVYYYLVQLLTTIIIIKIVIHVH